MSWFYRAQFTAQQQAVSNLVQQSRKLRAGFLESKNCNYYMAYELQKKLSRLGREKNCFDLLNKDSLGKAITTIQNSTTEAYATMVDDHYLLLYPVHGRYLIIRGNEMIKNEEPTKLPGELIASDYFRIRLWKSLTQAEYANG